MDSSFGGRARAGMVAGAALLTAVVLAACGGSGSSGSSGSTSSSDQTRISLNAGASGLQSQYELVVRTVLPSVVQIATSDASGSGVVFDTKGDIVTNAHVVGSFKNVEVRPSTGNATLSGRVIGTFEPDDLAVVRVTQDAGALKPAGFANSENAAIGQIVLAMGNPLGLTNSVTQGIVSATGRTVTEPSQPGGGAALIASAIQTTAAINPGNSGGALVDLQGQVLGIPTLQAREPTSAGGVAPGIGFAIPSNTVKNIAGQLIDKGRVTNSDRASLGITAQTMANGQGASAGVTVVEVTPGGPADKAGLQPGDVIVGLNGEQTPSLVALEGALATLRPGDKATVHLVRDGKREQVTVRLGTLSG
jgi:S1-C subfamily serine protease